MLRKGVTPIPPAIQICPRVGDVEIRERAVRALDVGQRAGREGHERSGVVAQRHDDDVERRGAR